ncbi:Chlorophyll(ide) b reductase NOL, chloroplastic [Gracilariopsis chorda]|uniref:Chlorophyll(Ide) b reductase NOL, chloroplastic n=1 Tax=Gracilariopsis chorda TaxID=448386 RepID=A0A2V3IUQ3_9FLOR|nr:Chlorophyll(ide) b reductase NOL, chloroplastic [Gracilariopsis chorda]|eukprot:PXF45427.1 Chlorophyll(ide) b reductase NOL, chloroplastic [Gracilariopsis chorda]
MAARALGVVVTGGSRGVGRALARRFLREEDGVVICARGEDALLETVAKLREERPSARVFGCVADVSKHEDVRRLCEFASVKLGSVDAFICNAGTVGGRSSVVNAPAALLESVVTTNLLGSVYCAKEAIRLGEQQQKPMHVFLVDGSGTMGNATANYAAYGATKRAVPQLVKSLNKECAQGMTRFHCLSPGMVLTELLLAGNGEGRFRKIFNFLAEEAETVADELVPRLRSVVVDDERNAYIRFLTVAKAMYRLVTGFVFGFRSNHFFDQVSGKRVDQDSGKYSDSGVRIE